jgi:putative transposase
MLLTSWAEANGCTTEADPGLAWWSENSKCAYQEAFRHLDRALRDYVKSRKGERKGRRLGFPRFKKRGKCRDSFRLTGAIHCGRTTVTLPRLGSICTHEPVVKLARKIDDGDGADLVGHDVTDGSALVRVVHSRSRA